MQTQKMVHNTRVWIKASVQRALDAGMVDNMSISERCGISVEAVIWARFELDPEYALRYSGPIPIDASILPYECALCDETTRNRTGICDTCSTHEMVAIDSDMSYEEYDEALMDQFCGR